MIAVAICLFGTALASRNGRWVYTNISTPWFENDCSVQLLDRVFDRLRDRHLLFIGDSTTRYAYLAAAYYLVNKRFPPHIRDSQPALSNERTFKSWQEFYRLSNAALMRQETCDCYRQDRMVIPEIVENRYLYVRSHNITVTYLQLFGRLNMSASAPIGYRSDNWLFGRRPFTLHNSTELALPLFFTALPRADFIVANSGLHHDLAASDDDAYFESMLGALELVASSEARLIWRTTAAARTYKPTATDAAVKRVIRTTHRRWAILDLHAILASINHNLVFWDGNKHVESFVNEEVLRMYFAWLIEPSCLTNELYYVG